MRVWNRRRVPLVFMRLSRVRSVFVFARGPGDPSFFSTREKNGRRRAVFYSRRRSFTQFPLTRCIYTHTYMRTHRNTKVLGCSGGALIGSLLFMPTVDLDALAVYAYLCATRARSSILGALQLRYYVQGAIREFAPANAHELCTNKLEMSITRMTLRGLKNLRLKVFETYEFFVLSLIHI